MCHLIAALQGASVQRKAAGHARAYGLWPAARLPYVAPVRRFNGLHSRFVALMVSIADLSEICRRQICW